MLRQVLHRKLLGNGKGLARHPTGRRSTSYRKRYVNKTAKPLLCDCHNLFLSDANSDEEYSDWNEKADEITCLFCPTKEPDMPRILQHMLANHGFDFQFYVSDLDFYQRIKLINYIRRQIHGFNCIFCERHCGDRRLLQDHMQNEDHCKIPDLKVFDQPL